MTVVLRRQRHHLVLRPTGLTLLCLDLDAKCHGRANRVFLSGAALMTTGPWMTFADWLVSFVSPCAANDDHGTP